MIRVLRYAVFVATLSLISVSHGEAQRVCRTGKPCGNTCIARNRTCRVGSGTARAATPTESSIAIPEGAQYVASSRGRVYYWVGCSAWRSLARSNLRFFQSRADAHAAGYTRSQSAGCSGPAASNDSSNVPKESLVASGLSSENSCVVSAVVDGDTLDCSDGRRIRLLLIDAPEMGQGPFGAVAKEGLESMAQVGSTLQVELDVEHEDRYGRVLAYLYDGVGQSINEEMVRRGLAVVSVYPPNVKYVETYRSSSEVAEAAGAGLWSVSAFACLPAEFRAGNCR